LYYKNIYITYKLDEKAVKLFGKIARAQASSRHLVGHILRRLSNRRVHASARSQYRRVTFEDFRKLWLSVH
jgi:hypothetical protein